MVGLARVWEGCWEEVNFHLKQAEKRRREQGREGKGYWAASTMAHRPGAGHQEKGQERSGACKPRALMPG